VVGGQQRLRLDVLLLVGEGAGELEAEVVVRRQTLEAFGQGGYARARLAADFIGICQHLVVAGLGIGVGGDAPAEAAGEHIVAAE
jgi:hypothetical protein